MLWAAQTVLAENFTEQQGGRGWMEAGSGTGLVTRRREVPPGCLVLGEGRMFENMSDLAYLIST